ncbi:MAG TPA: PD-(D/E)XK nuclease family protein, partial [Actinomycetales bacterium]|nr:PD-(D/E)XK nuclease family protein [Actinomycetales bacterium]
PIGLEIDIDTPVANTTIRCRIDAVFEEPDGRILIVDWKTGAPPKIGSSAHQERSVQLAIYRLAWARLHGLPLEEVDAVFVHVQPQGITEVRALELTDAQIAETLARHAPDGKLTFA